MSMLSILFDHPDFVFIDKPAGILVHSNPRFPDEYPILQRLRDQLGHHVYPVHRLDRQTSGCLLFAKQSSSVESLAESIRFGTKCYWAFVRGSFSQYPEQIVVQTPIKTQKGTYKDAESSIRYIAGGTEPRSALLKVIPKTGRRHQVRRHVRDLHHPILHDGDHGDSRINRWWAEHMGLHRLALHCYAINLSYQNVPIHVFSPLPDDLHMVFTQVSWWENACTTEPALLIHKEKETKKY